MLTFAVDVAENSVVRERVLLVDHGGIGTHPRPVGAVSVVGGSGPVATAAASGDAASPSSSTAVSVADATSEICRRLRLRDWPQRVCINGGGVAETLMEAIRMSVYECQHQFLYERWNCSLDRYRINVLQQGIPRFSNNK